MSDYTKIPSGSIRITQLVNTEDVRPNNKNSITLIPLRGLQIQITLSQDGNAVPVKKLSVETVDSNAFQYRYYSINNQIIHIALFYSLVHVDIVEWLNIVESLEGIPSDGIM